MIEKMLRMSLIYSAETLFHAGKISKYTGIRDFIGVGQTSIQVPGLGPWVGPKLGFYLGEGIAGLVNN